MYEGGLSSRISTLIANARQAQFGPGLSLKAYRAFEEQLGRIQKARDAHFAQDCFPKTLLSSFIAGCWHYRSLSQRGSIWAIHPRNEWVSFERSQDVFDHAYRFTQVMTEFFRQSWLESPPRETTHATVTLQRAKRHAAIRRSADSLHIEYPDVLATSLLPSALRPVPATGWTEGAKRRIRAALKTARLDTYLSLCQSRQMRSPVVTFMNKLCQLKLFKASERTTFPPPDPMNEGVFAQTVDPLLQLIQSGIFWLEDLARKTKRALTGYLLLFPPGRTSGGKLRIAWPWCSVNVAVERGTLLAPAFLELHRDVFDEVFDYVYGDIERPSLGDFAPGAELAVLRLSELLARQKHEGQDLSFHVVVGLKSVVNNGLRCALGPDSDDVGDGTADAGTRGDDSRQVRNDRLTYYAGKNKERSPEVLPLCPILASTQESLPPEGTSGKCAPDVNGTCKGHDDKCQQIASAVLGNYAFFQQRDAVLWALADKDSLALYRAFIDRGFLFPGQLRTWQEIVRELCLRNPSVVVYECVPEGVYRVQCTYSEGRVDVTRERWGGDRFVPDRDWMPWDAVNRAYECYSENNHKRRGRIPDWCRVLYRVVERLVDGRKGGTFVLAPTPDQADKLTYPMTRVYFIERHSLSAIGEDSRAEQDLYHLAIEDGAVVLCVDADTLILGRRYLTPKIVPSDAEWYGDNRDPKSLKDGARHTSARLLSKSRVVVLCVSADGPISLYSKGKRELPK